MMLAKQRQYQVAQAHGTTPHHALARVALAGMMTLAHAVVHQAQAGLARQVILAQAGQTVALAQATVALAGTNNVH
jgi:hypothetical protein